MHLSSILIAVTVLGLAAGLQGAIHTQAVTYRQGDTELRGFIAYDDAVNTPRPGVLIVPEWWGLNDYIKQRAEDVAKLGYVAFAADIYGGGFSTDDPKEAAARSSGVRANQKTWRARAAAGLAALAADQHADPHKLAAIGYCFGGTTVIELAMSGADLRAAVTFHGGLDFPALGDVKNIKCPLLIQNGAADTFIKPQQIETFEKALDKASVPWTFINYSSAHHAFTNPKADTHGIPNIAYNARADQASWEAMKTFLAEAFK